MTVMAAELQNEDINILAPLFNFSFSIISLHAIFNLFTLPIDSMKDTQILLSKLIWKLFIVRSQIFLAYFFHEFSQLSFNPHASIQTADHSLRYREWPNNDRSAVAVI